MRADGKHHTLKDLYHERTNFDFLHRKWRWALLSGIVLLAGLLGFLVNGLNLGIDFTGGTVWELTDASRRRRRVTSGRSWSRSGSRTRRSSIVGSKGVRGPGRGPLAVRSRTRSPRRSRSTAG